MKSLLMSLVMVVSVLIGSVAYAAVQDDSVLSAAIKEADGVSGQDTNSGSGIKTDHIQDGAVTDGKIAGPISSSKIEGLADALAGKSDIAHNHDAVYQRKYGKVAVVALSGGDYTDPVAAMSALASWCGTPSSSNPCLLKIMPGVYNIGSSTLQMAAFVDLEGSGVNSTTLYGNPTDFGNFDAVVVGAGNSEIRNLTIENGGGSSWASEALHYNQTSSCVISNVRLKAAGGPNAGHAIGLDTYCESTVIKNLEVTLEGNVMTKMGVHLRTDTRGPVGSATLDNVSVNGANYAFYINDWYDVTVNNLTAIVDVAPGGNYNWSVAITGSQASLTIKNSVVTSNTTAISNNGTLSVYQSVISAPTAITYSYGTTRIIMSQMDGNIVPPYGAINCLYSYNSALEPWVCN